MPQAYFNLHPFIEKNPKAVLIRRTHVPHRMGEAAKLREGLTFATPTIRRGAKCRTRWSTRTAHEGQLAPAIGSPLGLHNSISMGVVRTGNRSLAGRCHPFDERGASVDRGIAAVFQVERSGKLRFVAITLE
ncbi:MAG: hypothetical protein ABIZ80_10750 [Bryobacteraceae bacterium]